MREARWERSDTRVGVYSPLISPGDDRWFMKTKLPKTADAFNVVVRCKLTPANAFFACSAHLSFIHILISCFFPWSDVTFPFKRTHLPLSLVSVYTLIISLAANGGVKGSLRHQNSPVKPWQKPCQSRWWHLSALQNNDSPQLTRPFLTADGAPPSFSPFYSDNFQQL